MKKILTIVLLGFALSGYTQTKDEILLMKKKVEKILKMNNNNDEYKDLYEYGIYHYPLYVESDTISLIVGTQIDNPTAIISYFIFNKKEKKLRIDKMYLNTDTIFIQGLGYKYIYKEDITIYPQDKENFLITIATAGGMLRGIILEGLDIHYLSNNGVKNIGSFAKYVNSIGGCEAEIYENKELPCTCEHYYSEFHFLTDGNDGLGLNDEFEEDTETEVKKTKLPILLINKIGHKKRIPFSNLEFYRYDTKAERYELIKTLSYDDKNMKIEKNLIYE